MIAFSSGLRPTDCDRPLQELPLQLRSGQAPPFHPFRQQAVRALDVLKAGLWSRACPLHQTP